MTNYLHMNVAALEAEIARTAAAIESLKARGHRTVDAEKHLEWMKERLRLWNGSEGEIRVAS
jgi:hypothetical protein